MSSRNAFLRQRLRSRPISSPTLVHQYGPLRTYSYQSPVPSSNPHPASSYRPPTLSQSPSSYSSSGLPDSSHPMPDDMPREDYAAPTAYTMSMLGRIIRYVIYGTIGLGLSTVLAVEGLHQYVEKACLAGTSHSAYLDLDQADPSSSNQSIPTDSSEYFAWTEDPSNPSWTGSPTSGGTSSTLSWRTRHALRSAWIALEWGAGSTGSSMISREPSTLHHGSQAGLKGMIGTSQQGGSGSRGTVNKIDTGYAIAEAYLTTAIDLAQNKDGVEFPPHLSVSRSEYPGIGVPGGSQTKPNRVAVDMLLRHAEVLERIGTPQTLHKASEAYERVLRSLVSSAAPDARPSHRIDSSSILAPEFSGDLQEAERLRLAQKISDVQARMGDLPGAIGWSAWAVAHSGMSGSEVGPASGSPLSGDLAVPPPSSPRTSSWFGSILGGPKPAHEAATMERTLHVNATPLPTATEVSFPDRRLSPPLLRSVISLLSAHSTRLAMSGDLPSARSYQAVALQLIHSVEAFETSTKIIPTGPDESLHRLWLAQRKALTAMHMAEVVFAQEQNDVQALRELSWAVRDGEGVIKELTSGRRVRPRAAADADQLGASQLDLSEMEEVRAVSILGIYGNKGTGGNTLLAQPAQRLLRDAQRSTAENWSLLGFLHERQAERPSNVGNDSSHHLQETALDCYERAIGWSKVAYGGTFSGVGEPADELDEMGADVLSVGYQRSHERLRAQVEAGLKSSKGMQ